jgi:hypothetical protein
MFGGSLASLIALALIVLVMISFWRKLLLIILALTIAIFVHGLYQLLHFLHR